MEIFFNSSMPRSGSTLMQNILGNNPDIYATPTSGIIDLLIASKKIYTQSPIFKAQDEQQMKSAFLHYCGYGLFGYFKGLTDRKYVIDKSRGWNISLPFLESFYPNPKVICMVRDLRDVICSMEKNFRKFPDKWDNSVDDIPKGITIGERVSLWMQSKPVGTTLNSLKEVIHRGYHENILFIKFEDLNLHPNETMIKVYDFLGIPFYQHDFSNIVQVTHEDDKFHGRYGQHKIKPKIEPVPSQAKEILGEFICEHLYEKNKWYFETFKYKK